jgi:hypothetical protein
MEFDDKKYIKFATSHLYSVDKMQLGNGSCFFMHEECDLPESEKNARVEYLSKFSNDAEYLTDHLLTIREKLVKYKRYLDIDQNDDDNFANFPNYEPFDAYCHNFYVFEQLMDKLFHISQVLKLTINNVLQNDFDTDMRDLEVIGDTKDWYLEYGRDVLGLGNIVGVNLLDPEHGYISPPISSDEEDEEE